MGDNWDDSDDDWDKSDDEDELDKRLGLNKLSVDDKHAAPAFDDEEDLAAKEKEAAAKASAVALRTKGKALAEKKRKDEERKEELELARKAMEMEAAREADMDDEERRARERERIEEDARAQADDLFGGVDSATSGGGQGAAAGGKAMEAGDTVKMKDLKDHLKHARKVAQCLKGHGKIHLASAFVKEVIQESKDVLDDDAISDLIKTMNIIKNEKVQAAKRKVKGQAQKSAKRDKAAEAKAKKIQDELYGDSNEYDDYDAMGEAYEDDFF